MKKITQISIIAISIFIASCKNTDNAQPVQNISYPAAYVVLAHSGMVKVALLDAVKGINIKLIEVPEMNHNAIYSPNGTEIWTSQMDEKGKVLVYDTNTYILKNTISVGKEPAEVTFLNDGMLAFVEKLESL